MKGSYGFTDERGIHRQVDYVADKAGFRAEVKTNEHGTAPLNPAAVKMVSSAHPYFGGAGKGFLGLGPLAIGPAPFVAAAAPFGVPAAAPFGVPAAAPFAVPAVAPGLAAGYGGPLLGGAIQSYDTRFGPY